MRVRVALLALVAVIAGNCARAEIISQIPGPFAPFLFNGAEGSLSQFDLGATPPNLQNFATVYDDFTSNTTGLVTDISWVGTYESSTTTPFAPNFVVSLYTNDISNVATGEPGTLVGSFSVGSAGEAAVAGFNDFFSYSTSATPFSVTAGTKYWLSVVADLDYADDGWGWAFSSTGVNNDSYQDFGDTSLTRFNDSVDYAFSVTVVPEPATFGLGLVLAGCTLFRRRRSA